MQDFLSKDFLSKDLASKVFPARLVGFGFAILITAFTSGARLPDANPPVWLISLCGCCAVYPFVTRWLHRSWLTESRFVRAMMNVDACLVALLIAANQFYPLTALALVAFLLVSTAIIAGFRGAAVALLVVMLVSTTLMFNQTVKVVRDPALDLLVGVTLLGFLMFVARLVYAETQALYGSSRLARRTQQSLEREAQSLGRYLSPQLVPQICAEGQIATRRRNLTICFTDLSGFTALMDHLPEDQMTKLLNDYLDAMVRIALDAGGTVDKFIGDGVMVFFGDPASRGVKQDAAACLEMALEMRRCLAQQTEAWRHVGLNQSLSMRIGIHSGYCAVGNFGSESRMDYTAIGGAVNIASRLEGEADSGSILVSNSTIKLVSDLYRFSEVKEVSLKGLREPVRCGNLLDKQAPPKKLVLLPR